MKSGPWSRRQWWTAIALGAAVVAVALSAILGAISIVSNERQQDELDRLTKKIVQAAADDQDYTDRIVSGGCLFWHDLAQAPLTPQTTPTGLRIVADSWVAYDTHGCTGQFGKLALPSNPLLLKAIQDAQKRITSVRP